MASQLRAVLPCMAEPINFKFLWREDHLSDYTLVICSEPDTEQPPTESNQQANELACQYRPAISRYIQAKTDSGAQRSQHYTTRRGKKPAMSYPSAVRMMQERCNPAWQPSTISPSATHNRAHRSPASAAAATSYEAPLQQQRKLCSTAPPEAAASRSRRNATAATVAAADHDLDPPAGPTTRSAKRRKQPGSNTTQQGRQLAPVPAAAAAAAATQAASRAPRHNITATNTTDQVVELASTSDSDLIVDWTLDAHAAQQTAGSRPQQQQYRITRADLETPAAAALASQGIFVNPRGLSPAAGPSGTPGPPAAAAAAGMTCSSQQQQQQHAGEVLEAAGGTSMPASPAAAAAGPSQPVLVVYRELPVHGAVLSAMSEYFRALIQNWQGSEKRLMMAVNEDEAAAAEALVEFMYTGELPAVSHDDMLKLMRLSDKFQVKNCPAACAHRFSTTPMEDLSLETVCALFEWPEFLQHVEAFKGVFSKAWSRLLELFGDLEVAWQDVTRRQQFMELPHRVMKRLLSSDAVAVFCENTVLVALAEWTEYQRRHNTDFIGSSLTLSLQKEVAEMVRLQHLSPTFLGSVLKRVPLMTPVLTPEALQAAARYATANEATRNKLHSLPNRQHRLKVLYAPPRARSVMQRLEFTWVLELQTVKAMIDQFRNTKVTVDRYSEPHYFNGFQWQLVLQVLEPPAKQPAAGQAAAAAAAVDVFVGTTARIQIAGVQYLPDVLYFRGQLAAREVASGDYTFVNRMESGFVCGTAGWGFRNFLRITDWDNEAALRRFFYDGKLHLRCSIDHCE